MVTIVLPTRNERAVGRVIDEIRSLPIPSTYQIIVVDHKSTDGTVEEALSRGIPVMRESQPGKGIAVRNALKAFETDYTVMLDADFTYPAAYIPRILEGLDSGAEVVACYRHFKEPGSMSFVNKLGNSLLSLLASFLYGYWIRDLCTGMWGFKRVALDSFDLTSRGFTLEADFFVNSVKKGYGIMQIPIHYRCRLGGTQPKLRLRDGLEIGWFLLRRRFA
jgi:dolichol-phosphate mannosyltransferase